jgi:hypothetical protein
LKIGLEVDREIEKDEEPVIRSEISWTFLLQLAIPRRMNPDSRAVVEGGPDGKGIERCLRSYPSRTARSWKGEGYETLRYFLKTFSFRSIILFHLVTVPPFLSSSAQRLARRRKRNTKKQM